MHKLLFGAAVSAAFTLILLLQISCTQQVENKPLTQEEMVALGKYIVTTSGCEDCHTPKTFTENGPMFDTTRNLAGFTQGEALPALDPEMIGPDKWIATQKHLTAWVGPWGISFAANLTPDNATGLGAVTEAMFIKTLREGKQKGVGRPLLPPMPWQVYGMKTDQDLKAIYAYLKSIKPIRNEVPQPVTPDKMAEVLGKK